MASSKRIVRTVPNNKRNFPKPCKVCDDAPIKRGRPKAKAKPAKLKIIRNRIDWYSPLYISEIATNNSGDFFDAEDNESHNEIIVHHPFLKNEEYPVVVTIIGKKGAAIQKTTTVNFTHDGISKPIESEEDMVITILNRPEKYVGYAVVFCIHATNQLDGPMQLLVASNTYATREGLIADIEAIFQPLKDAQADQADEGTVDADSEIYDIPGMAEAQSLNDLYRAICKVNIAVEPHRLYNDNNDDDDDDDVPDDD